jgi:hypothetical protein
MNLADELLDHRFGGVEVGNHAFPHGADRLDAARGTAKHQLGVLAHGQNLLYAVLDMIGDDGGFR